MFFKMLLKIVENAKLKAILEKKIKKFRKNLISN